MKTLQDYQHVVAPFRGKLVIFGLKVVRLMDVMESHNDFFWSFRHNSSDQPYFESVDQKWIPLQGSIKDEYYAILEARWNDEQK